jgi:hypothetical protein
MFIKYFLPLIILTGCGKTTSSHPSSSQEEQAQEFCAENYRVLPIYKNTKNYLAFENFGARGVGRCRGHAIVSQTMEMLAKFNPNKPHPCLGQDEATCFNTLNDLVTQIFSGSIKEIGGFNSLFDFSSDVIAQKILHAKVASISSRYSATESPLESYDYSSNNMNIYFDIIRRLKLRHRPYVGILGKYRIGNHAVIAYRTQSHQKMTNICVRDPNIVMRGPANENCQNYFYLKGSVVMYHQINQSNDEELLSTTLQTDEDDRVEQYIQLHYQLCQGTKL